MAKIAPSERLRRELDEVLTGIDGELTRSRRSVAWAPD